MYAHLNTYIAFSINTHLRVLQNEREEVVAVGTRVLLELHVSAGVSSQFLQQSTIPSSTLVLIMTLESVQESLYSPL